MAEKTKLCKHCGEEIPKTTNICPKCGKKNSGPNGCLIVIGAGLVLMTLSAIGSSMGASSGSSDTISSSSENTYSSSAKNGVSSDDTYQVWLLQGLGEAYSADEETFDFKVSDNSKNFINTHPNLFPTKSKESCLSYVDDSIEFKHLMKSTAGYTDKLMNIEGTIYNIEEVPASESNILNKPLTIINLYDHDYNYYEIFYLDAVEDAFKDDTLSIIALPLDTSSYTNVGGGTTQCVVAAAAYIEKK